MNWTPKLLMCALAFGCSGMLLVGSATFQPTFAQETQKSTAAKPEKKTRKAPRGRIPNGFGKVGVTDKQREEIYRIQAQYREEVRQLQQELDDLKEREYLEVYDVLTDDQKAAFKKWREEASAARRKRAAERR